MSSQDEDIEEAEVAEESAEGAAPQVEFNEEQ
jgi:hypothetical protein